LIDHTDSGDRSAITCSIVVSCHRRGVDLHDYIRDVVSRSTMMTARDDLTASHPAAWKLVVSWSDTVYDHARHSLLRRVS